MPSTTGFVPYNRPTKTRKSSDLKDTAPKTIEDDAITKEDAIPPMPEPMLIATPEPSCALARLPPEIRKMIYSNVDYQSLIRLSTTDHFFNKTVDPQALADPASKIQFVVRAAKDFPQHRPREKGQDFHPGNYECYLCYRVRSPELFDVNQARQVAVDHRGYVIRQDVSSVKKPNMVFIRRFCIECGLLTGLHAPADSLTTKTGHDFWVCSCRKLWARPDVLRCNVCQDACPFRPRKTYVQLPMTVREEPLVA